MTLRVEWFEEAEDDLRNLAVLRSAPAAKKRAVRRARIHEALAEAGSYKLQRAGTDLAEAGRHASLGPYPHVYRLAVLHRLAAPPLRLVRGRTRR